jgi:hypothetical protein
MDRLLITIPIDTIGKIETIGLIAYSRTLVNRLGQAGEGDALKKTDHFDGRQFHSLRRLKINVDIRGNLL